MALWIGFNVVTRLCQTAKNKYNRFGLEATMKRIWWLLQRSKYEFKISARLSPLLLRPYTNRQVMFSSKYAQNTSVRA